MTSKATRGKPMGPAQKEALAAANAAAANWFGKCRCGLERHGSLADLMAPCPRCGRVGGDDGTTRS